MIWLQTLTMIAIVGTAGFFILYLTALEGANREDRQLGRTSFLDQTGAALVMAARSAFFWWIGLLIILSVLGMAT